MNQPRALDAFACEGGYTRGLMDAGWHVTAVDTDKNRLARNPAHVKIVADAVEYIGNEGHRFHYRHASPPCQRYTHGNAARDTSHYPDLIGPTRDALLVSGGPYTIENVSLARKWLLDPILLCGTMFGLSAIDDDGTLLRLRRHRLFESSTPLLLPPHHHPARVQWAGVYGGARSDKHEARHVRKGGYTPRSRRIQQELLGVDWMTQTGMKECLPPAYGQLIGQQILHLLAVLDRT